MTGPTAPAGSSARAYHQATKHSPRSIRASGRVLDWANRPSPFKVYRDLPVIPLPRALVPPSMPTLQAVAGEPPREGRRLDLQGLAALLFFAGGLTHRQDDPGRGQPPQFFRAAPSTGALYEIEIYAATADLPGLPAGVYHFGPEGLVLGRLREGDWRATLAEASSEPARVSEAPVTLILSALYWRNSWKYGARAFRHFFWDAGTLLANLLATATALGQPAAVLTGFADHAVNALLGLDPDREGSLVLVPLGSGARPPPAARPPAPLAHTARPLSAREQDEPLIRAAYRSSSLPDGAAARSWAAPGLTDRGLRPVPVQPSRGLGDTILHRGSTRVFARRTIPAESLRTVLDAAHRPLPLDANDPAAPLAVPYLLVHAVEGLVPGAYAWDGATGGLRPLREGNFRDLGGFLCLEQALGADASAVVFYLSGLGAVLARYGDRGYRAANLAAGLLGGRLYLCGYALGLGASGLTFYDDEVVAGFGPLAEGHDALFVTALGLPHRRPPGDPRLAPAPLVPIGPGEASPAASTP